MAHTLQVDGRLVDLILLAQRPPHLASFAGGCDNDCDSHSVD